MLLDSWRACEQHYVRDRACTAMSDAIILESVDRCRVLQVILMDCPVCYNMFRPKSDVSR